MTEISSCPNCNAPIKGGMLSSNKLLSVGKLNLVTFWTHIDYKFLCDKCGSQLFNDAKSKSELQLNGLRSDLRNTARYIPVVSTHNPYNWEYVTIGMVTGQSTAGTGMFSEINGAVADLFGGQAGRYNSKLKGGENLCFEQLRGQAIMMGGNAVVGCDIDYSEVGGGKGMLMVCMAGTVIKIKNLDILPTDVANRIQHIETLQKKLAPLEELYRAAI